MAEIKSEGDGWMWILGVEVNHRSSSFPSKQWPGKGHDAAMCTDQEHHKLKSAGTGPLAATRRHTTGGLCSC